MLDADAPSFMLCPLSVRLWTTLGVGGDSTITGVLLGVAPSTDNATAPESMLSSVTSAVLLSLVHCGMYVTP